MSRLIFHHQKFVELDGYDEIILIEEKLHRQLNKKRKHSKRRIPESVVRKSRYRLRILKDVPISEFQGAFSLLYNDRCHYTKDGKVYK